jgi:hypothetical protein
MFKAPVKPSSSTLAAWTVPVGVRVVPVVVAGSELLEDLPQAVKPAKVRIAGTILYAFIGNSLVITNYAHILGAPHWSLSIIV